VLPPADPEPAAPPTILVTSNGAAVAANSQVALSTAPSLSLVASLVPPQGTTLSGTVSWQYSFVTSCCGPNLWSCGDSTTLIASSAWDIGADVGACGGAATITAVYAGYPTQSLSFSIMGTNPTQAAINSFVGSSPWFLHRIIQLESGYQQFTASGAPKFGPPNGFGLMQVDPPASTYQIWDWTQNATAGLAILNAFSATTYWNTQLANWASFNSSYPAAAIGPPSDTSEGPCVFSYYSPANGSSPYSDAVWMKRYNSGYNGPFIQFNQFIGLNGTAQGVWLINDINTLGVNYVQVVCSAIAP
jgi:hypothetical protein